ncbi:MAG TPA: CorA family divalent cation transporter [Rhodocyclaceae bacterium]|nr:CorA family divalent cation transporter [Rhodocyclaceae bacterium]
MADNTPARAENQFELHLSEVQLLLARHRRVEDVVRRQEMQHHDVVENLVHRQHLVELQNLLRRLTAMEIARLLEALAEEDRITAWNQVEERRCDLILEYVSDELREELVGVRPAPSARNMLNAFELRNGRLNQVQVDTRDDLANIKPIWVDLVAPSPAVRAWVGEFFGVYLPDPDDLTDIETSARFFVDDNGEVHLHSDFLLDAKDESRNVAVAFILHQDILFSVRKEELPVFRLQRLRARTQPGYVADGKDLLLDLYAADVEYSADTLEDIYADFEAVSKRVLHPKVTDEEAARILAEIARGEDLNGRIRRNVLDTRRALSFLTRGKLLTPEQQEESRQILRDIESLDVHTSFLFGKINFLLDATVGFININQNKRVSRLTAISVVFLPINIIAGIGGMSEFSMMTQGIPWPVAYGTFVVVMSLIGWVTYVALQRFDRRKVRVGREAA